MSEEWDLVGQQCLRTFEHISEPSGDSEIHGEICWSLNTCQWLSRPCDTHLHSLTCCYCSVTLGLHHELYTCTLYWNNPFSVVCSATHQYGRIGICVVETLPWLSPLNPLWSSRIWPLLCSFGILKVISLFSSIYGLFFRGHRKEKKKPRGNDDLSYRSITTLEKVTRA